MPDLRYALNALVEQPPASPVALDVLAGRAERFTRRRRVVRAAGALALVPLVSGAFAASAAVVSAARRNPDRAVVVATQEQASAAYVAVQPGGYVAKGTWRLTITRGGEVIELNSESNEDCGPTGIIQPGDEVRGYITGPDSRLSAGERFSCP